MLKMIIAVSILLFWLAETVILAWDDECSTITNLLCGLASYLLVGLFYIVPFWMIFVK
ncbi:MAG: hypothetical protein IJ899_03230 [Blautia sp.]|nr:hypothetical protein [Blautia sp.]